MAERRATVNINITDMPAVKAAILAAYAQGLDDALQVEGCPACEGVTGHWHGCGYGLREGRMTAGPTGPDPRTDAAVER